MGHRHLRRRRTTSASDPYLVTTVTLARREVFRDFWLARFVVRELRYAATIHRVHSLAWVVMPEHVHWLLLPCGARNLSDVLRTFKGRSARAVNAVTGERGPLWQRAFHDRGIRDEQQVLETARYLVANPLRRGLVTNIGQYPHWDAVWLPSAHDVGRW